MDERLDALMGRLRERDARALSELYELTVTRAYAVALRVVRVHEAAEEVVADAYLQVWNSTDRFDSERGNVIAWLLMITRSRALDHLRRVGTVTAVAEPEWLEEAFEGLAACDPLEQLTAVRSGERVHRALKTLPAVERQMLALAFFRGMTHQEIAVMSRLPLGTVKTHIRRGLLALREVLADSDDRDGKKHDASEEGHHDP